MDEIDRLYKEVREGLSVKGSVITLNDIEKCFGEFVREVPEWLMNAVIMNVVIRDLGYERVGAYRFVNPDIG